MSNIYKIEFEVFKNPTQFGFDWREWLDVDTIDTSVWIIPDELTKEGADIKNRATFIFLSGGVVGEKYKIDNIITTTGGITMGATSIIEVYKEK